MSPASIVPFDRRLARARKRIDPVLLAAAVLCAALVIGELIVILHAAPALDPLAPYYVT
jgi:hypothetical protein